MFILIFIAIVELLMNDKLKKFYYTPDTYRNGLPYPSNEDATMSDTKKTDKSTDKEKSLLTGIRDSAHKIWLAGLGAYAQYEKLGQEGIRLFENLVKDGEEVQARTQHKVDEVKEKIKSKTTDRLESRIKQLRDKLSSGSRDELKELSHQIEELSQAVKALSSDRTVGSKGSATSSSTGSTSKSSTTSTAKKPAAV